MLIADFPHDRKGIADAAMLRPVPPLSEHITDSYEILHCETLTAGMHALYVHERNDRL